MAFNGLIAEIPIGNDGLIGTKNIARMPLGALLDSTNTSYAAGTVGKEGGSAKYNSSAITGTPAVMGGWDWNHDGDIQRMIVLLDDGTLKKDTGGGAFGTTLASGLTVQDAGADPIVPVFVEGGKEAAANDRKLFIFTGRNAVQVLSADGATTSGISTPPADWATTNQPTFGLIHEGRLWGGGNANDAHRLYYSTTGDHEDLTGSGSGTISIYPGEGERLVNAVSYRSGIVCFKYPRGIYYVDTSDPTVASWKVIKISDKLGAAWIGCVSAIQDDVAYVDATGDIRLLTATDRFGSVDTDSLSDFSEMDDYVRSNLTRTQIKKWKMVYYPTKKELHLACTGTGATVNNRRIVVDFNRPDRPRFRVSDKDSCVSLWLRQVNRVPELTSGDDAGFVWRLDQESRAKDGVGYAGQFQTPHMDFSDLDPRLGTARKAGKFLELVVEPKGNWNLSCQVLWDGEIKETVQFNMGTTGASLGSFVLGTDKLAEQGVLNKKRRITGSGRRLSIMGTNSGAGQDFSVARMFVHFKPSDERLDT